MVNEIIRSIENYEWGDDNIFEENRLVVYKCPRGSTWNDKADVKSCSKNYTLHEMCQLCSSLSQCLTSWSVELIGTATWLCYE